MKNFDVIRLSEIRFLPKWTSVYGSDWKYFG